jgi:hypothetical protein
VAAVGLIVATAGFASGAQKPQVPKNDKVRTASPLKVSQPPLKQHGSSDNHLPPARRNVELVSRLRLTDTPGGIADVHYYKGFAYLAKWAPECPNGGVDVVDVRNPQNPRKVAFIPAGPHDYVGEGVHTIHIDNRFFTGDVLLVNHEACDAEGLNGISLWDVTNPREPWPLALHQGDFDIFGPPVANSVHSVLGFKLGDKAYAVLVDNFEFEDVDIMDISNPGRPELIAETGLDDWPNATVEGLGASNFHHDVWFKRIDGVPTLGVSYWDVGWVFLDVSDPANPAFLYDTDAPPSDLLGFSPPEGNAHQGEWSQDSRFWFGTDEDFAPHRVESLEITTGPNVGSHEAVAVGGGASPAFLDDLALNGPTVYGGYGCPPDLYPGATPVPLRSDYDLDLAEGEEAILVLQRGPSGDPSAPHDACFPGEKAGEAIEAGWDAVLLVNRHFGSADGDGPPFCGSGAFPPEPPIVTVCTTHEAFHRIFNTEPAYDLPYDPAKEPDIGAEGEKVSATAEFDGWGYLNMYDFRTGEFLDYFAPGPTLNPDLAFDSGTLSVHEIATDQRRGRNLGYLAWYGVGLQVVKWSRQGIENMGVYRHAAGNDFWGVSLQKRGDRRPLIYMSDRDSGLWIFRYTGPE